MPMAEEWFVRFGDEVHGPISSAQLRQLVRKGVIKPGLPVRRGQSKWVAARKIRGLFEAPDKAEPAESQEPIVTSEPQSSPPPETTSPPEPDPLQAIGIGSGESPAQSSTDEALALPIDLHLDADHHLIDHRTRIEPPPEPPEEDQGQLVPAHRRRPFLRFEGTVRSIGLFFFVNALLALAFSVAWAIWVLQRLGGMSAESNLRGFYAEVLGTGAAFLTVIGSSFLLAGGLRNLRPWARWVTATLMIQAIAGSLVAEILLAIVGSPWALRVALLLIFLGMLIPGYIAFVMLQREGDVVFSTTYRDWAAQSPGLRPRRDWAMMFLLLVEVIVVVAWLYLSRP